MRAWKAGVCRWVKKLGAILLDWLVWQGETWSSKQSLSKPLVRVEQVFGQREKVREN